MKKIYRGTKIQVNTKIYFREFGLRKSFEIINFEWNCLIG